TFDQLADDLDQRRTTSAALVDTALAKAKAAPYVFLTLLEDEARAAAADSDRRRAAGNPLGPLDGIPIASMASFEGMMLASLSGVALTMIM
ncbi:MAG: amidase, partial [Mycetocola sp.]